MPREGLTVRLTLSVALLAGCIRWNDAKGGRETFTVAEGGEPFEGFRWRSDEALKLNFLWVLFYVTDGPAGPVPAGHVSKVWFDNIVAATEYIGPLGK